MTPLRPNVARSLVLVAALALVLVAAGCGNDSDDSSAGSTTTTAKNTTTTAKNTTTTAKNTTTTAGESAPGDTGIDLTLDGKQRSLTVQACSSEGEGRIDLTATDADGNTLTLKVADGTGSVTYRGASEDREGKVWTLSVQDDGTFDASGVLSVADDSAPTTAEMRLTGLCSN